MEQNRMPANNKHSKKADVENRVDLNGKKGKNETGKLKKTEASANPGADNSSDTGDASASADLGGK